MFGGWGGAETGAGGAGPVGGGFALLFDALLAAPFIVVDFGGNGMQNLEKSAEKKRGMFARFVVNDKIERVERVDDGRIAAGDYKLSISMSHSCPPTTTNSMGCSKRPAHFFRMNSDILFLLLFRPINLPRKPT